MADNNVILNNTVTLTGSGSETFTALDRQIRIRNGAFQFLDVDVDTTITVKFLISLNRSLAKTRWTTLVDSTGTEISFTITTGQSPLDFQFQTLSDIVRGTWITPVFDTGAAGATGDITVNSSV